MDPDFVDLLNEAQAGSNVARDALLGRYLPGLRAFVRLRSGEQTSSRSLVFVR